MSNWCCSNGAATTAGRPSRLMTAGPAGGLMCGVLWLLCPKCPACVAGYLALFGGVTLSLPAMAWALSGLRGALMAALAVGVGILVWRLGRSLVR
jgi:hypothetical protein